MQTCRTPLVVKYVGSNPPQNAKKWDIWFDTQKKQLKLFDGSKWIVLACVQKYFE